MDQWPRGELVADLQVDQKPGFLMGKHSRRLADVMWGRSFGNSKEGRLHYQYEGLDGVLHSL